MEMPEFKFALGEDLAELCAGSDIKNTDFLPRQAEAAATGFDVRCAQPGGVKLIPGTYYKIPLGFRIFAPEGWWLKLVPRSSTFTKLCMHSLYGTIDQDFFQVCMFVAQYNPDHSKLMSPVDQPIIQFGDRIGQLIPSRRQEMKVSEVSNDEFAKLVEARGAKRNGGFGSTSQR